jgi:hypothetical protein
MVLNGTEIQSLSLAVQMANAPCVRW